MRPGQARVLGAEPVGPATPRRETPKGKQQKLQRKTPRPVVRPTPSRRWPTTLPVSPPPPLVNRGSFRSRTRELLVPLSWELLGSGFGFEVTATSLPGKQRFPT